MGYFCKFIHLPLIYWIFLNNRLLINLRTIPFRTLIINFLTQIPSRRLGQQPLWHFQLSRKPPSRHSQQMHCLLWCTSNRCLLFHHIRFGLREYGLTWFLILEQLDWLASLETSLVQCFWFYIILWFLDILIIGRWEVDLDLTFLCEDTSERMERSIVWDETVRWVIIWGILLWLFILWFLYLDYRFGLLLWCL